RVAQALPLILTNAVVTGAAVAIAATAELAGRWSALGNRWLPTTSLARRVWHRATSQTSRRLGAGAGCGALVGVVCAVLIVVGYGSRQPIVVMACAVAAAATLGGM